MICLILLHRVASGSREKRVSDRFPEFRGLGQGFQAFWPQIQIIRERLYVRLRDLQQPHPKNNTHNEETGGRRKSIEKNVKHKTTKENNENIKKHLPKISKTSPNIFQEIIRPIFQNLPKILSLPRKVGLLRVFYAFVVDCPSRTLRNGCGNLLGTIST